ncbi:diguanylate cyclase [Oxynema sp. CENA135]|uniref:diguanylate cyclase domain-containing protein n=1 Tax=Oxynema sp. CENA135 TaxID=984206 RepID=UPI00190C8D6F|nr:diguanylate cyclase [Oxynema sp. CENA135]MBK4728798.1 diguanylate cyclase [Oxynema sp. CENA135]
MLESSAFSIHLAIERHPVTVAPQTSVGETILLMSQAKASCVVVVEDRTPVGIFTERDLVKLTARCAAKDRVPFLERFGPVEIAEVMSQKPIALEETSLDDLRSVLNLLRQYQIRHLPIVNREGDLVGIVTHQSIRDTIQPADWMRLRRVKEVMGDRVITAPETATVNDLARLMHEARVSCIAISRPLESDDRTDSPKLGDAEAPVIPLGIVTERDILQFHALGLDARSLHAAQVMSSPLLQVQPTDSLWSAHQLMNRHRIRRLVVTDERGCLCGIITQTSLLQGWAPMEMTDALSALQRLVEERTSELQQANTQLRREIQDRKQTEEALRISQARLAGILNIADDAIVSVDEHQCIQLFNQGAEKIFGYRASEAIGQPLDLLLPEAVRAIHRQHVNQFRHSPDVARQMGSRAEVLGRRKDGSEFAAEASISKLQVGSEKLLTVILRDITDRKQAQAALQLQLDRERLMGAMRDRIRQSLNLDEILNTTVAEVRQFLVTDRVIVYQFNPDWSGQVVVESVSADWLPILGLNIHDPCFGEEYAQLYAKGRVRAIPDIFEAPLSQCHRNLLKQFQVKGNLVVPILQTETTVQMPDLRSRILSPGESNHNRLWGLLIAHHCRSPRQWQDWEVDFLTALGTQVAIAIQQSTLFEQLQAANQQLRRLATLDGLTQVANRRRFDEYLDRQWRHMARDRHPLSLILCDIDCFKLYNDTYGHQAGDECLQSVAATLTECVKRPCDLVARYGGEEFAVILPDTDPEGARNVAERIRRSIFELSIPNHNSYVSPYVTMSVGVATTTPEPDSSWSELIALADKALYASKNKGRNRAIAMVL